jgi:broad specificity phosphatase PhoE
MVLRGVLLGVLLLLLPATSLAQAPPLVVVLVRHAEKATDPPEDPALSAAGRARAEALAAALADADLDAVVVTQYKRTQETGAPAAQARGLTPIVIEAGADTGRHAAEVAAAIRREPPGSLVLAVGHSNTVPAIIRALGGPPLEEICEGEYANFFTLVVPASGAPRLLTTTYGAPDRNTGTPCGRTMRQGQGY